MREHGFLLSANRPNAGEQLAVFQQKQYLPRPERGGGRVLFCCGPWPGLLERLWFVAPIFLGLAMDIVQDLYVIAVRQLVKAAGMGVVEDATRFLFDRFTNHSERVTVALQKANDRAWKTLESALIGRSFLDFLKPTDERALAQQFQVFLDTSQLREIAKNADRSKICLAELREARRQGFLTGGQPSSREIAQQAGNFAKFSDPQAVLDKEWELVQGIAKRLQDAKLGNLATLLRLRPPNGRSPMLAVAVQFFFRREVETDQQLFQGLTFAKLEGLSENQQKGLEALTKILTEQGSRFDELTGQVLKELGVIVEIVKDTYKMVQDLQAQVQKLVEQRQLQHREVRPGDSMSIRNEGEMQLVKQLVAKYRTLPEEKRRQLPELLSNLGKLELAAGDFGEAQQKFQNVATMESDPKLQAEAHYNASQAALQRQDWAGALASIRQAAAIDPARFTPFPLDRYEPTRILGAGGFGVAYLCHHKFMKDNLVVKTLQSEELDCNVDRVFSEAQALRQINHPSIIRLSDCGYADANGQSRPYLAMDYFEGANLESYVAEQGSLSPEDLMAVAVPVAEALQAAHARGIMHRDVKPANILVNREGQSWRVKLIDFGLALRPSTLEGQASTSGPRAQTTMGKSIAGTLHYAAPEQMGQLPGVAVGPYSDVYGFGKSCYYALLKTSEPDDVEKDSLPEPWRKFLGRCTGRLLDNRLPDFAAVLAGLTAIRLQGAKVGPADSAGGVASQAKTDWNDALASVTNAALVAFYKKELAAGQENYLRKRYLHYRIAGKRRWFVAAHTLNAYVWQSGRFDGDIDFWRSGLNKPDQVKAVKGGACVSFSLSTAQDFQFFRQAAVEKLRSTTWTEAASDDEPDAEVDGVVPAGVLPLYLRSKGIVATGYEADDGFVVLAGSQAVNETVPSFAGNMMKKRKGLIDQGMLVAGTDCLILKKDFPFDSPSLAASVMLGRSSNGRTEWKDEHGKALKELEKLDGPNKSAPGQDAIPSQAEPDSPGSSPEPERYGLRLKFWQGLLSRAKAKNTRHANIAISGEYNFIGAGSGLRGLPFNYVIRQDEVTVEVYIDRGPGKAEENKRMFDSLHKHKNEIEQAIGGELAWQRLEGKQACRIGHTITVGGYRSDESTWPEIHDAMIDAMMRLEKAITPYLEKLKTELVASEGA